MTRYALNLGCTLFLLASPSACAADAVSFRHEVMAVLSRAGCNQGTCHGNLHGKGGFKLSLRGEDPGKDFIALTRDQHGRRISVLAPEQSLILQKASGRVPHEGSVRFAVNSNEYRLLRNWIADGARDEGRSRQPALRLVVTPGELFLSQPERSTRVSAEVEFADGSKRDVSSLAVFESINPKVHVSRSGVVASDMPGETTVVVRYLHLQSAAQLAFVPARPEFKWIAPPTRNYIDELVDARLRKLRMNPSPECGDSEFLRRAYLDLLGLLPSATEVRAFLNDTAPDKRARLVDRLLERPEFADTWAVKWSDVLRNEEKQLDRKGTQLFYQWIRDAIAEDKPLNQFARELIASRGSSYKEPAANYYRALRDPHIRAEATAQVFLGIRMQCAKCHNHPFNQWTQNDYHQLAAFFPRVQYRIVENNRKDKLDKHEFVGEQIIYMDESSEVKHPYTGAVMKPRLLGGPTLDLNSKQDRLNRLADWVAEPSNPYFARTQANRIWSHLMGRGIVEPNDDFRESNPPVNGPLLDALARDLAEHAFSTKHLIRTIMTARVYQQSATPNDTNSADETNCSHTLVRPLAAEALLDAIAQVSDTPLSFDGYDDVRRAGQLPSMPSIRRGQVFTDNFRFLKVFGKPERLLSCDCERSDAATLAQALSLITGEVVNRAVAAADNRLGKALAAGVSNEQILSELYLCSLCREPAHEERTALLGYIERTADRRAALEDILWGLLNSKEFLLRK